MSLDFTYQSSPARIVFGAGRSAEIGEWIGRLGCKRALVLATPHQAEDGRALAERLGELAGGVFTQAAMHTPVDVSERAAAYAQEIEADCLVALGGGSTIGLAKALALRTDLPQIAVPTTYAGSEATPILGQTEAGRKTTQRSPKVLPEVVIYDPLLSVGLPVAISVTSGLNAVAHAAEGLYAPDRSPITTLMAVEAMRALHKALPAIVEEPQDHEARGLALYGAWLCGTVLGQVAMSLHHKICHTLGGSFDMPHAETHAVMLPHTIGFNAEEAPDLCAPIGEIFGDTPGRGLFAFAARLGSPLSLRELGLKEADLDRAAAIATENPYSNPRPFDRLAIRSLLGNAWAGREPPH